MIEYTRFSDWNKDLLLTILMSYYIIRRMQENDIPQVIEIDREAFPTQWPRPTYSTFKQELRNRLAYYIVAVKQCAYQRQISDTNDTGLSALLHRLRRGLVFKRASSDTSLVSSYIVGMAGFWVMVDEAHITTIAVRRAYQRQGIGERLLISIIEMAAKMNAKVVTLEVRVSNVPAQTLYEKYGFQKVGLRRAYYTDNGEDALLMTTSPIDAESFHTQFEQLKYQHESKWRGVFHSEMGLFHEKKTLVG